MKITRCVAPALIALLAMLTVMVRTSAAQPSVDIDAGVRGGMLLQIHPKKNSVVHPSRYGTAGLNVGVLLANRVEVRFESVYDRFRYQTTQFSPTQFTTTITSESGHSWVYPLLADYRFLPGHIQPFAGGGLSLGGSTRSTLDTQATNSMLPPTLGVTKTRTTITQSLGQAYYLNAGVDLRPSLFSIRPEVRYTRWSGSTPSGFTPNQVEFLVEISVRALRIKAH